MAAAGPRRPHADRPQLRRSVVYGGRIYVVGGSTSAGASHSATGSRVVEWFVPD